MASDVLSFLCKHMSDMINDVQMLVKAESPSTDLIFTHKFFGIMAPNFFAGIFRGQAFSFTTKFCPRGPQAKVFARACRIPEIWSSRRINPAHR